MKKKRLDLLLVELGLVESRTLAQRLIMAGQVRVDEQVVLKSSSTYDAGVSVQIEQKPRFVSRGGDKLEAALQAFKLNDLQGCICADVGASTGGFTDCLLQHGASRVYAIDVGYGELHWSLRNDKRISIMERTNARYVKKLPEPVQLVTIDASFISLRLLVLVISGWFSESGGQALVLIKPQFEAGKADAAKGKGVIRDVQVHYQVLLDVLGFIQEKGWQVEGVIRSPVIGSKGNVEFLAHLIMPKKNTIDINQIIKPLFEGFLDLDDIPVDL